MTLTEKDFQRFKNGGDSGTGVYMWEGTTSRVMAADRPYGEFMIFTASVQNILDRPSYIYQSLDISHIEFVRIVNISTFVM
jgi:hypothetical protein